MLSIFTAFVTYSAILSNYLRCTALSLPANITLPTDLPNNSDPNLSLTDETHLNGSLPCCTSQISWLGFDLPVPKTFINNCRAADEMLQAEISAYGSKKFDFLFRGYTPIHGLEVIRTPTKYTAGMSYLVKCSAKLSKIIGTVWACTITIVNLNVVPRVYLHPAHSIWPFPESDVASYYDIRDVLADIWARCLYGPSETQVGYGVTGECLIFCVGNGRR